MSSSPFDDAIRARLDERGLRYTTGRRLVVRGLRHASAPVTLPALLAMVPELAQSSAYRNLALLEEAGVVRRLVHGTDHAHYELAEHLTEHHHHLICNTCGVVRDVTLGDDLESRLDRGFEAVASTWGFALAHHNIELFGTCADCSA